MGVLTGLVAAAAVACPQTAEGPRYEARVAGPDAGRTAVVVCDHRRGRERTLRAVRSRIGEQSGVGSVGRAVRDVALAGTRVAWVEGFASRRAGYRASLVVYDLRRRRVVRRRVVGRTPSGTLSYELWVALSARGDLAWAAPRGRDPVVLQVQRRARAPRRLPTRTASALAFGERSRTLRWLDAGRVRFFDVRPPAQRDGCPARPGWAPVASAPELLVTRRWFDLDDPDDLGQTLVFRGCVRGSGEDRPLLQGTRYDSGGTQLSVAGSTGRFVAFASVGTVKAEVCSQALTAVEVSTGRITRRAFWECDPGPVREPADDGVAITTRGVPAWIARGAEDELLAAGADERLQVLDRAPRDTLRDLRADGELVRWSHAGAPREARP